MKNFEKDQPDDFDSLFEAELREQSLSGKPKDRDAIFFQCGRASMETELASARSILRRYRMLSVAATVLCGMLGSILAVRSTTLQSPPIRPATNRTVNNELDGLKQLLVNRIPQRSSEILGVTSSFEKVNRLPELTLEPQPKPLSQQDRPLRVGDIQSLL